MPRRSFALLLGVLALACGRKPSGTAAADSLTRRQRDSAIGASNLPGAKGVQGALRASDSIAAHTAAIDSIGGEIH